MPKLIYRDRENPIFETVSFNSIINSLDNVKEGIRVSLNSNTNTFIYCDMSKWIHSMMLRTAIEMGHFNYNGHKIENNLQLKNAIEKGFLKPVYNFGLTNKKDGIKEFMADQYTKAISYNDRLFFLMLRPDSNPIENTFFRNILSKYKIDDINY